MFAHRAAAAEGAAIRLREKAGYLFSQGRDEIARYVRELAKEFDALGQESRQMQAIKRSEETVCQKRRKS